MVTSQLKGAEQNRSFSFNVLVRWQRLPLFSKVSEIWHYLIAVIFLHVLVFQPKQKQLNKEKDKRVVVNISIDLENVSVSTYVKCVCVFLSLLLDKERL